MIIDKLWKKIASLRIGSPTAQLTFTRRLARENGWPMIYAEKVIREYRRFIYLSAISKEELTPSDPVNQAWHLHLSYTHSYWKDMCGTILGFEIHHFPMEGGVEEQERFRQQYQTTLDLYQEVFDEPPPSDIWPRVDIRFMNAAKFVRIDQTSSWIVRKPGLTLNKFSAVVILPLMLVACATTLNDKDIRYWITAIFAGYLIYITLTWIRRKRNNIHGCGPACGGCGSCNNN